MNVVEKKVDGLVKTLEVTLPSAVFSAEFDAQLAKVGQKKAIPGFRKGKVPLSLLKQHFGNSARSEAIDAIIKTAFQKIVQDKNLKLATPPQYALQSFEKDVVVVDITVELMPDIKLPDFSKFNVERLSMALNEDTISDAALSRFQDEDLSGDLSTEGAKKGDVISMSYSLSVNDKKIDSASQFVCRIGSDSTLKEFQDGLEGVKSGEKKTFTITFPKDYGSEEIKGQKGTFDVEIKEVRAAATLNDDFAKARGFDSLESLRKASVSFTEKDANERSFLHVKRHVLDLLDKEATFPAPPTMVQNEFKSIWQQLLKEHAGDATKLSDAEKKDLEVEYQALAERRVRLGMLVQEISKVQKISVATEDLQNAVMDDAVRKYPGYEEQFLKFIKDNPKMLEQYHGTSLEKKVIEFIVSQSSVTEKQLPAADFNKEIQKVIG